MYKDEVWKIIEEFKDIREVYISNYGRVKNSNGDILKSRFDKYQYKRISFTFMHNGKKIVKTRFVHRLMAIAFLKNPNNYTQVQFKNGNRHDIRIENLMWCKKAICRKRNTYNKNKPILNINTNERFKNISEAARRYNIGVGALYNCCIGKMNTAGGYKWKYEK